MLKHADQRTLVSETKLSESAVSRALRRLVKKKEVYCAQIEDPSNNQKLTQDWHLMPGLEVVGMVPRPVGQRGLSDCELQLFFCGWLRLAIDARQHLLEERYLGNHPPASVTYAKSQGPLIEAMAHQFQADMKNWGLDLDQATVRSVIRPILKRRLIATQRIVMLNLSSRFEYAVGKLRAKRREEAERNLLTA